MSDNDELGFFLLDSSNNRVGSLLKGHNSLGGSVGLALGFLLGSGL